MSRNLFILFIMTISFQSCVQSSNTLTRDEVFSVINRFDSGWRHKSLRSVDSTLSPQYVYFTQSGSTFSRDSVVATAGESDYLLTDMSRSDFDIVLSGSTAVVSTRWKGKGMYRGVAFDEDQRCSIVVTKKNGRVEILSEHCTPIKSNRIFH